MADIIPFRSQFDIDCETAVCVALFGADSVSSSSNEARKRIERRRRRLGLGYQYQATPQGFDIIE